MKKQEAAEEQEGRPFFRDFALSGFRDGQL
jgi:hypothetical protein